MAYDFKAGDVIAYGHCGHYHCVGIVRSVKGNAIQVSMARCVSNDRNPDHTSEGWSYYQDDNGRLTDHLNYVHLHPDADRVWAEIVAQQLKGEMWKMTGE